MDKIGSAIFLICIVLLACAGYVFYRYDAAREFQRTGIADGVPATICEFSTSSFESAQAGRVYVYEGTKRFDLRIVTGQKDRLATFFVSPNGQLYGIPRDPKENLTGEEMYLFDQMQAKSSWECRPWWWSDPEMVRVPPQMLID